MSHLFLNRRNYLEMSYLQMSHLFFGQMQKGGTWDIFSVWTEICVSGLWQKRCRGK